MKENSIPSYPGFRWVSDILMEFSNGILMNLLKIPPISNFFSYNGVFHFFSSEEEKDFGNFLSYYQATDYRNFERSYLGHFARYREGSYPLPFPVISCGKSRLSLPN